MVLAAKLGWTLDQIHAQKPRFIDELVAYLNAEAEVKRRQQKRMEERLKALGRKQQHGP